MAGTTGNTNAAKWTRDHTWSVLDQIEEHAWDESIITLSQALLRVKCYKQLWSYWKKKWEQDGDLIDRIYYIEQIFINKLEEGALYRRLHPSACYFILRNNYGCTAKGERELPPHLQQELEEPQPGPATAQEPAGTDTRGIATSFATILDPAGQDIRHGDLHSVASVSPDARAEWLHLRRLAAIETEAKE